MPPYLPFHYAAVYISGFFEILFGLGLLFPKSRYYAAWGLILLLIAVYPANIYLAFNEVPQKAIGISALLLLDKATDSIYFHRSCILAFQRLAK